jgi:hypothetical protein
MEHVIDDQRYVVSHHGSSRRRRAAVSYIRIFPDSFRTFVGERPTRAISVNSGQVGDQLEKRVLLDDRG